MSRLTKKEMNELRSVADALEYDEPISGVLVKEIVHRLLDKIDRLSEENSFLCPAGDFDVITTLKAEKIMYMEEIDRWKRITQRMFDLKKKYYEERQRLRKSLKDIYEQDCLSEIFRIVERNLPQEERS